MIGEETNQYAVCVPTGKNRMQDTNNGFFMTMDKNVGAPLEHSSISALSQASQNTPPCASARPRGCAAVA